MEHHFNIEVAEVVGVNAAIIFYNINHWCDKNKKNGHNFFDGEYWTYNSLSAFSEQFTYLSKKQICSAIEKLKCNGFIKTGSYNKNPYDRTIWYCDLTQKVGLNAFLSNVTKGEMEDDKRGNVHSYKRDTSITDNNPDNNPDKESKPEFNSGDVSDGIKKELSDKEKADYFISTFNKTVLIDGKERSFKSNPKIISSLKARLKQYPLKDILKSIRCAMSQEFHIKSKYRYLTPEFCLRVDKIEMYLNMHNQQEEIKQNRDSAFENPYDAYAPSN